MVRGNSTFQEAETYLADTMRGAEITGTFKIDYKVTPGTANPDAHIHSQYEMLLCLSDDMFLHLGEYRTVVGKNTLVLFNNMDLHHFGPRKAKGENTRWVLYFDPALLNYLSVPNANLLDCFLYRPTEHANILTITEAESEKLQTVFEEIVRVGEIDEAKCYGKELRLVILLAQVLLDVNDMYRDYHHIAYGQQPDRQRRVYAMMEYIHENYMEKITLDELAAMVFVNKYAVCEDFKAVLGISPQQYIINCRMQKAKELLLSGSTVDAACGQSGFNNLSHFSRSFKEKTGLSPKQYQMKHAARA